MPIIKHFHPHPSRNLSHPSSLFRHESLPANPNPCPPYPFPPNRHYPPANHGLYGSSTPQSGNRVSQGKNKGKTLRKWYPNVRLETIRSEALGKDVTIRITAAVMRTIRKAGGLDAYLLGTGGLGGQGGGMARIKELGVFGWRLRWAVVNTPLVRERFAMERERLGLISPASTSSSSSDPALEASDVSESSDIHDASAMAAHLGTPETFSQAWEQDPSLRQSIKDEMRKTWEETRAKEEKFRRHVRAHWEKKDGRVYVPPDVRGLPEFNSEGFRALVPEGLQREGKEV